MWRFFLLLCSAIAAALLVAAPASAQHEQHGAPAGENTPPPRDAAPQDQHQHVHAAATQVLFPPSESSGTSWLPDRTPMYGFHFQQGTWEVMLHGNGFLQLLHEDAPEHRGATQAGSINWAMAMARRAVGAGRAGVRTMVSLEPWTVRGCGYPNLLATGEFCDGDNIHDRQHPHDLFMELAADSDRPLRRGLRWQVYAGLAGEPALGPPAFPHRLSAMPNPISPIAHHWFDATHITYGVVTTGVYTGTWKAEASLFNGREPDERRTDLDLGRLDSASGRFWLAPTRNLVVQVSAGHLNEAEMQHQSGPSIDVDRFTGSATYHRAFGSGNLWASTVGWGANRESGATTHGVLAESAVTLGRSHTLFGRAEVNGKPAHDLHIHESSGVFTVGKLQAGYTRYVAGARPLTPGIGAVVSATLVPDTLRPRYGGVGVGIGVFLTLRPAAHEMGQ